MSMPKEIRVQNALETSPPPFDRIVVFLLFSKILDGDIRQDEFGPVTPTVGQGQGPWAGRNNEVRISNML